MAFRDYYKFDTWTSDADPGAGEIAFNNGTYASVTAIYIDDADANGVTTQADTITWDDSTSTIKGYLHIVDINDSSTYARFSITGSSNLSILIFDFLIAIIHNSLKVQVPLMHYSCSHLFFQSCLLSYADKGLAVMQAETARIKAETKSMRTFLTEYNILSKQKYIITWAENFARLKVTCLADYCQN